MRIFFKSEHRESPCRKPMVLIWTILWLVIIAIGLEMFFRSGVLWKYSSLHPYFLLANTRWHHNAFLLEKIKSRDKTKYDEYFVLIGGSATGVQAITSDAAMAKALCKASGKRIGFTSLAASYGSIPSYEKIIHALKDADVTIVMGVSYSLFCKPLQKSYEVFQPKTKRQVTCYYFLPAPINSLSILTGFGSAIPLGQVYITPNSLLAIGEVCKNAFTRWVKEKKRIGAKYRRSNTGNKPAVSMNKLKKLLTNNQHGFINKTLYMKYSSANLTILEKTIKFCQANSIKLVVYGYPRSNYLYQSMRQGTTQYYKDMAHLLAKYSVPYHDFQKDKKWPISFYYDPTHMRNAGKMVLTPMLAAYLAKQVD